MHSSKNIPGHPGNWLNWLLQRFKGLKVPAGSHKFLFLGLDCSGKTSVLYGLQLGEVLTTMPTIGFNLETVTYKNITINGWDVGGCDKIRPLWRLITKGSTGIVFVLDSNDRDRLGEARDELWTFLKDETLQGVPLLVLANKQDLPNASAPMEIADKLGLADIKDSRLWHVEPCVAAARPMCGVYEGLDWLMAASSAKIQAYTSPHLAQQQHADQMKLEAHKRLNSWLSEPDPMSDDEFLAALEDCSLIRWDHYAHLRLAWLYLTRYGRREGKDRIFNAIRNFIETSPVSARKSGNTFHETMTYFWMHMVHHALVSSALVCNPQLEGPDFQHMRTQPTAADSNQVVVRRDGSITHHEADLQLHITESKLSLNESYVPRATTSIDEVPSSHPPKARSIHSSMSPHLHDSNMHDDTNYSLNVAACRTDTPVVYTSFHHFLKMSPHLVDGGLFLQYYSRELMLQNPDARKQVHLPDIQPLPSLVQIKGKQVFPSAGSV